LNTQVIAHLSAGGSPSATYILLAAMIGYLHGGSVNTERKGVSRAVESLTEIIVSVLRYSADAGFADTRKEQQNGGT
jgi:hypothetical protein